MPILALTPELAVARRLSLFWSVHCIRSENASNYEEMVEIAQSAAKQEGYLNIGQSGAVVAGIPSGKSGATNNLRVFKG